MKIELEISEKIQIYLDKHRNKEKYPDYCLKLIKQAIMGLEGQIIQRVKQEEIESQRREKEQEMLEEMTDKQNDILL